VKRLFAQRSPDTLLSIDVPAFILAAGVALNAVSTTPRRRGPEGLVSLGGGTI